MALREKVITEPAEKIKTLWNEWRDANYWNAIKTTIGLQFDYNKKWLLKHKIKEPIVEMIRPDGTVRILEDMRAGTFDYTNWEGKKQYITLLTNRMLTWKDKDGKMLRGWIVDEKSGTCLPQDAYFDSVGFRNIVETYRVNQKWKYAEFSPSMWDTIKKYALPLILVGLLVYFVLPAVGIDPLHLKPAAKEAAKAAGNATIKTLSQNATDLARNITLIKP